MVGVCLLYTSVIPRRLALAAVYRYSVPYLVLDDKHTDFFKLCTEFLNIKADKAVMNVNVCPVAVSYTHLKQLRFIFGNRGIGFDKPRCHFLNAAHEIVRAVAAFGNPGKAGFPFCRKLRGRKDG